jgi:opacity protein-like surface antigen
MAHGADDKNFYLSADAGRSTFGLDGATIYRALPAGTSTLAPVDFAHSLSVDTRTKAYGLQLGYRIADFAAVEASYSDLGHAHFSAPYIVASPGIEGWAVFDQVHGDMAASHFALQGVLRYRITGPWSAYGKLGLGQTRVRTSITSAPIVACPDSTVVIGMPACPDQSKHASAHSNTVSGVFGAGLAVDFARDWSAHLEWMRTPGAGSGNGTGKAVIDTFMLGLSYKF